MLYREIIAVCSQIHTKLINTLCGQNVELLNVKLIVYVVTVVLSRLQHNTHFLAQLSVHVSYVASKKLQKRGLETRGMRSQQLAAA